MDQQKRKVSSRITAENFVSTKTNVVTKQLKLSANATGVASMAVKQRQASVEDGDDDDEIMSVNNPPKNPNVLLDATDGSDDDDDIDPAPELENTELYGEDDDNDNDNDELKIIKPIETAEAQWGQYTMEGSFPSTSSLGHLYNEWVSPIYAFFEPTPSIVTVDGQRVHKFKCTASL